MRALLGLVLMLCLASCGGGGGGGGGSSGGGSQTPGSASVKLSASSLQFQGLYNASGLISPAAQVTANLTNGSGTYYGRVVSDSQYISGTFQVTGSTSAILSFQLIGGVPAGRFSGNLVLQLCTDQNCSSIAWAEALPYTAVVYQLSAASLTMSAPSGGTTVETTATLTPTPPSDTFAVQTDQAWLSASLSGGTLSVAAAPALLAQGGYTGNVVLGNAIGQITVPVQFTVGAGTGPTGSSSFNLNLNATTATLARQIALTFPGAPTANWHASTSDAWIDIETSTGTPSQPMTVSIYPALLPSTFANFTTMTGHITVSTPGLADTDYPITVTKSLPEVYMVTSGVVAAGTATTISVSGKGLSQLTSASQIQVAGQASVTGAIGSDTQVSLSLPALGAGAYKISIANAAGLATVATTAVAESPVALPATFVARTGVPYQLLYDASRSAVFVSDLNNADVVKYSYGGGSWSIAAQAVTEPAAMTLSPDFSTLYLDSGPSALASFNASTLTPGTSWSLYYGLTGGNIPNPVTANNRIWLQGGSNYLDLGLQQIVQVGTILSYSSFSGSPDGQLFIAVFDFEEPSPSPEVYSTATDSFTAAPALPISSTAQFSQDHSVALSYLSVLNVTSNYSLIGTLPSQDGSQYGINPVLSADGTRVYVAESNYLNQSQGFQLDHITVYDATSVDSSTGNLLKLGTIAVSTTGTGPTLAIDPLGLNLFSADSSGLTVLVIPTGLRPSAVHAPNELRAARGTNLQS